MALAELICQSISLLQKSCDSLEKLFSLECDHIPRGPLASGFMITAGWPPRKINDTRNRMIKRPKRTGDPSR
jgi:hypothetical protein